jgi:hypothetical protein
MHSLTQRFTIDFIIHPVRPTGPFMCKLGTKLVTRRIYALDDPNKRHT